MTGAARFRRCPQTSHFLSLSRDGRTLLALDAGSTARVYDTTGKGLLAAFAPVSGAALSPDGSLAATTDAAGIVRLHERADGQGARAAVLAAARRGRHGRVCSSAPTAALSRSHGRDHVIRHWDLAANAEAAKFPWCNSLIFSGDSRWRIGTMPGGTLNVWDAVTGQEKVHWPGGGQLTASADGRAGAPARPRPPRQALRRRQRGEPVMAPQGRRAPVPARC